MSSAHYQRRQVNINPVTNSLIHLGDLLIRQANIRVTTKSVVLTNQYLAGIKAYSMIIHPSLSTLHVTKILRQNHPVFRRKTNTTVLLKKCTTRKWLLLAFWKKSTNQCLTQSSSSEGLPELKGEVGTNLSLI